MGNALYKPSCLYTSRIYLTEDDGCDITLTTVIPYDFYELPPLETEDYITACCPDLLNGLSPAIFGVLLGRLDVEQAIQFIRKMFFMTFESRRDSPDEGVRDERHTRSYSRVS